MKIFMRPCPSHTPAQDRRSRFFNTGRISSHINMWMRRSHPGILKWNQPPQFRYKHHAAFTLLQKIDQW